MTQRPTADTTNKPISMAMSFAKMTMNARALESAAIYTSGRASAKASQGALIGQMNQNTSVHLLTTLEAIKLNFVRRGIFGSISWH